MGDTLKKRFDYIIVGAGAAGCVLANRLSADPNSSVLLLEAGVLSNHWRLRMPMAAMDRLSQSDKFCWKNWSEPEAQLDGRRIYVPSGRVIGGSSSINGMVHIKGESSRIRQVGRTGL
jgi:Choline dehydrogenase and related flavoproteins